MVTANRFTQTDLVLERAAALAREVVASLPDRPVLQPASPEQMAAALDEPLPKRSSDPVAALEEWLRRAEPGIVASAGPRYFGFVSVASRRRPSAAIG